MEKENKSVGDLKMSNEQVKTEITVDEKVKTEVKIENKVDADKTVKRIVKPINTPQKKLVSDVKQASMKYKAELKEFKSNIIPQYDKRKVYFVRLISNIPTVVYKRKVSGISKNVGYKGNLFTLYFISA